MVQSKIHIGCRVGPLALAQVGACGTVADAPTDPLRPNVAAPAACWDPAPNCDIARSLDPEPAASVWGAQWPQGWICISGGGVSPLAIVMMTVIGWWWVVLCLLRELVAG
eukprot:3404701-Karenia_brevis.AAC.1